MKKKQLAYVKSLKNQKRILNKFSGRNNYGRITVRHKGGGYKNFYKSIKWYNMYKKSFFLFREYDSKRTSFLTRSLGFNNTKENAFFFYKLSTSTDSLFKTTEKSFRKSVNDFEVGDLMNNISLYKDSKPIFSRSTGTSSILLRKQSVLNDYLIIKLPSGKIRLLNRNATAAEGFVNVSYLKTQPLRKAGQSRWKGIRPTVRGVAMNPIDHPHGGGEGKTSGGRPHVSPWGKLTKGGVKTRRNKKTNLFVLPKYTTSTSFHA